MKQGEAESDDEVARRRDVKRLMGEAVRPSTGGAVWRRENTGIKRDDGIWDFSDKSFHSISISECSQSFFPSEPFSGERHLSCDATTWLRSFQAQPNSKMVKLHFTTLLRWSNL